MFAIERMMLNALWVWWISVIIAEMWVSQCTEYLNIYNKLLDI